MKAAGADYKLKMQDFTTLCQCTVTTWMRKLRNYLESFFFSRLSQFQGKQHFDPHLALPVHRTMLCGTHCFLGELRRPKPILLLILVLLG